MVDIGRKLAAVSDADALEMVIDGSRLEAIGSVGLGSCSGKLQELRAKGRSIRLLGCSPYSQKLLEASKKQIDIPAPAAPPSIFLEKIGRGGGVAWQCTPALFSFVGECAQALLRIAPRPRCWRWRQMLKNIEIAGFDALPIIGLTAFLLGIVVAYQGEDQLRHYGANISSCRKLSPC